LSRWWVAPFVVDGTTYASAEHSMMVGKAPLFGDEEAAARVLAARTPGEAKAIGRVVRGFDDAVWAAARMDVVVRGNPAKFGEHPRLRDFLLGTGSRVLVEASPVDRVRGIGLAADDPRAAAPSTWWAPGYGRNLPSGRVVHGQASLSTRAR
jgi:ribA/ribD-fused uncharacterized protein